MRLQMDIDIADFDAIGIICNRAAQRGGQQLMAEAYAQKGYARCYSLTNPLFRTFYPRMIVGDHGIGAADNDGCKLPVAGQALILVRFDSGDFHLTGNAHAIDNPLGEVSVDSCK